MAGFKTHITTSSVLGVGYTGLGLYLGLPIESSLIAGGLCGIGGMLPDIDSDSGVPFRESMGFAAAIIPLLMLDRFRELGLNYEQMVLICGAMYLFVRFGVARLLSRYTVHRGMFHSLPAALIFAGVAFLLSYSTDLQLRYFKAAGVFIGVMSHLLLDELYSVEWKRGRWHFKKSFGTALKLWSKSAWGNISTYGKLIFVVLMILGEPMVMQRYGQLSPVVLHRDQLFQPRGQEAPSETPMPENPMFAQQAPGGVTPQTYVGGPLPPEAYPNGQQPPTTDILPSRDRTIYDTARRIMSRFRGEAAEQQ